MNKKIIFITITTILTIVLVALGMYYVRNIEPINNKIETGEIDDSNIENNNSIDKKFFEEYLKVFEYLRYDFKIVKDDDIRDFIVFKYIVDREAGLVDFKNIMENSEYNEYIEVLTKDIENLVYKYFGGVEYKVKSYEGERFYKIEVKGEKTKIYTKAIGFDRYDMKIEEIEILDEKNLIINTKFTNTDYDPSDEYAIKFYMTKYEDGYRIYANKVTNIIADDAELKDFAGNYIVDLGPDGIYNIEIASNKSKLNFDWSFGPFNGDTWKVEVEEYKLIDNKLMVKIKEIGMEREYIILKYRNKQYLTMDGIEDEYYPAEMELVNE